MTRLFDSLSSPQLKTHQIDISKIEKLGGREKKNIVQNCPIVDVDPCNYNDERIFFTVAIPECNQNFIQYSLNPFRINV